MDKNSNPRRLFWLFLRSPSGAAEACLRPEGVSAALKIYIAFTFFYLFFFWIKPPGFPDPNAAPARQGLLFWLQVMLWQPPLEAAWIVFLVALVQWFKTGRLPLKITAAVFWTAIPFILTSLEAGGGLARSLLAPAALLWISPFYLLLRGLPRAEWLAPAGFMLGLNAISLALLPPMIMMTVLRSASGFTMTQAAGGLWMLAAAALGLRRLSRQKLARVFMSVLLSMFLQIALALSLQRMNLIPKDIFKALLYV